MKSKFKIALVLFLTIFLLIGVLAGCDLFGKGSDSDKTQCTEHKYGEWITTTEATCLLDGSRKRVCRICKEEEIKIINALGHEYVDKVCKRCNEFQSTSGLVYRLNDDGESYSVEKMEATTETDVVIARIYCGKPVTGIGKDAFYNCTALTAIDIPDSVTSIGNKAFRRCSNLTVIDIPDSVTNIGEGAFFGCDSLKSINLPSGMTVIEDSLFYDCAGLTNIKIPDGVTSIGNYAFFECSSLTDIDFPADVENIGDCAFFQCGSLTSIEIPDSVTSIGEYAFLGCPIENASMPSSLIAHIPNDNLKSVVITSGESIGYEAFYNCESLTSVKLSDGVTRIENSAFSLCGNLMTIEIPDSVTDIENWAFFGCGSLQYNSYGNALYLGNVENQYIVLVKAKDTSITSCEINDKTKKIMENAFAGCGNLTSVIMGNSVTDIGYGAFQKCDSLTAVYITDVAKWCGIFLHDSYANPLFFAHNLYLNGELVTDLVIPDSVTDIGQYAFFGCSSLKSMETSDSLTSIADNAFCECSGLTSIIIGDSVTSIGEKAFLKCSGLTNIKVGANNTKYRSAGNCLIETESKTLILGCATSVIPSDGRVTRIAYGAFGECGSLTSIEIPDCVTNIGNRAFYGCRSLTSVVIGNGVTSIENSVFAECSSLQSVVIGNGVLSIGYKAFSECSSLTSVVIPVGVTRIGDYAFNNCSNLTSIDLTVGVTNIGQYAFSGCTNLISINYGGTVREWQETSKENKWNSQTGDYTVYCTNGTLKKNGTVTYK